MKELIPHERIEHRILVIRGKKVLLDRDLAKLYGAETRALLQAVKRNIARFPEDFMFQLTKEEANFLVSQNVIPSKRSLGGRFPYAFNEQGIAMLSSVINSEIAIQVNIAIIRAFVKMRQLVLSYETLAKKIDELEKKINNHDDYIITMFEIIKELAKPAQAEELPKKPKGPIGFK